MASTSSIDLPADIWTDLSGANTTGYIELDLDATPIKVGQFESQPAAETNIGLVLNSDAPLRGVRFDVTSPERIWGKPVRAGEPSRVTLTPGG